MAEKPANLHVAARTADGRLWHTIRSPGGWTGFGDVLVAAGLGSLSGRVVDVACARRLATVAPVVEGLYLLVALSDQPPRLLFRSSDDGSWRQEAAPFFPTARRVAIGTLTSLSQGGTPHAELHLAAVTDDGHLVSAIHEYGNPQPALPDDVEQTAGDLGELRAVALSDTVGIDSTAVPLLAVTGTGRVMLTTGRSGQWNAFTDLQQPTGPGPLAADVLDAGMTTEALGSNFVAVTGDGHVWLATQFGNGTWRRWTDLETFTATFSGGPGVSGTFTSTANVGTFTAVASAGTAEGLHVLGVTTDGRLWHQLRSAPTPVFRDVEQVGVGQDIGAVTATAAA